MKTENIDTVNFLINWRKWYKENKHVDPCLLENKTVYQKSIFYSLEKDKNKF